jgi:hypothetical protein
MEHRVQADFSAESFDAAEARLRRSVAYGEYDELDTIIAAYCQAGRSHLDDLPGGDQRHHSALTRILNTIEWSRLMLCAARASNSRRLDRALRATRYLPSRHSAPTTFVDF